MFPFDKLHIEFANQKAFISNKGECKTYQELNEFSIRMKPFLKERALVFALCENTAGSLMGYYSFISNGVVPLLLDSGINRAFLDNLTEIYTPNYFWLPSTLLSGFPDKEVLFSESGYSLIKIYSGEIEMHKDLALLLTTSGSTGSPKFVKLTYKNIIANAESIAEYLNINRQERPITVLPMHYSYGLSVINSHLIKGATILLSSNSITEKDFWTFLKTSGATSISGVPYTYQILKRLRMERMDLPELKTMTQAGGKLSPELVSEFADYTKKTNKRFFVMYGQTEATARMSYLPCDKALEKNKSIGIAIPGGKFSIIDTQGNNIDTPETAGELIYQGDNVSMGYAETKKDLSAGDINSGILHTGDLAMFDQDGFYYLVGRLKRFVKIFGNRINLDRIEEIVKKMTPDCACTGTDDNIIIYLTDPDIKDEIKNSVSQKSGIHPSAIIVRIIHEIPKNTSGKIQYSQLQ